MAKGVLSKKDERPCGRSGRPAWGWLALAAGLAVASCARLHPPPPAALSLPPTVAPADLTDAQWLQDLDHLRRNINKVHEHLMYSLPKHQEFEERVRRFRADLSSLNPDERMAGLLRVIAALGDPHTRIAFRPTTIFPLEFYWFKEGIFVTAADPGYEDLLHAEVVGLGRSPLESVVASIKEIIPHENEWRLKDRLPGYLALGEILHGLGLIPSAEEAVFAFRTMDGKAFEARVEARPFKEGRPPRPDRQDIPIYLANPNKFYWYRYLEGSHTVFFQYNSCHDMPGLPFVDFSNELLTFIRRHDVERVVVDLRHNYGGFSGLMRPFIRAMTRIRKADLPGGLYVIIGRRTFSAAVLNALELRRTAHAVLVGEPTGGKPSHYGDIRFFALPASRMTVSYPTQYIWREGVLKPSLMPDHLIEPSVEDWISGRDPVLEAILLGQLE